MGRGEEEGEEVVRAIGRRTALKLVGSKMYLIHLMVDHLKKALKK
jgi:hypothetical protein